MQIGNANGTTGAMTGDIALSTGTTLQFNRTGTFTYDGDVLGGGSFTKVRAGTVIATGDFSNIGGITITAGIMQFGDGGATGSFGGDVTNNATIDINRSGIFQYGDVISGSGALDISGPGNVILTNINTYTGDTTITNGILSVNGQIGDASSTVNIDGGKLGGTGTILGTVDVNSGGTLGPGNSIGTLNVTGNVNFAANSQFEVEIAPDGTSDLLAVDGIVTIAGGTVLVIAPSGAYVPGTIYTVITATGGRNGTFAGLDTSLAFVTPELEYDPNSVMLVITRNSTKFTDVAATYNEYQVASALQTLPLPEIRSMMRSWGRRSQVRRRLSTPCPVRCMGQPPARSSTRRTPCAASIIDRLIQSSYGNAGGEVAALGAGGPINVAMRSGQIYDGRMALGAPGEGTPDVPGVPAYGEGLVFWTQAYGSWGEYDGNGNAATLDRSLGGFVSGVDTGLPGNWRAGLATGYTRTDLSVGARQSSSDVDSYLLAAYAGGAVGDFIVRSGAAWSWNSIDATRNVIFPGFFETETASYNGDVGQLFAEIAHPYLHGRTAIEPFAGVAWVRFETDSFTESGGDAALTAASSNDNVGYSTLGLRAASTMPVNGVMVTPRASVAWRYAFGDTTPNLALAFAQSGAGFGILGVPLAQNSALLEAGLDIELSHDARLGVSYVGQLAGDLQDNGVQANLLWRF